MNKPTTLYKRIAILPEYMPEDVVIVSKRHAIQQGLMELYDLYDGEFAVRIRETEWTSVDGYQLDMAGITETTILQISLHAYPLPKGDTI